ncbi:ABC transporter substrate-binding protein [Bifidobacterium felsineum]|uniref:ABC transporter substrate-binding protein n=1 Tax=Bifidobacterium felsineum TaxID=2045440 RepID=A0A2M9HK27_9BIFI|nr:sugar ABC transporter substrate-binding protein [Bifidobacterium felsineum]MBT1165094.1 sugar ABC transporter substrate-binding protein [Bifidobacterium felsineum]PJM77163.1 ABC transporter substrate-binding protein [Bifidobacterium felsineum]
MRNAKKAVAAMAAITTLVGLAACGNSSTAKVDTDTANAKGEIVFWGWGNGIKETIDAFEKANPNITVKYSSTGTAADTATALQNAIAAGKGAPDVIMLEDATVPQFVVDGSVIDLSQFGADKFADDFAAGPWAKMLQEGKPYALPIDSSPEVFFYNKATFDKAGVDGESIKTWDDYYEAAKKVRALGGDYYITNSIDYQPFLAQAWQAGAQPFKVDGENITINMNDKGLQQYVAFQQKLIDEDLINPKITNWSDDWYRSLGDGTTATLSIGAWMPTDLETGAAAGKGNWRVAQLPQWTDGEEASSEDGGSSLAITAQSKNTAAAYKFAEFLTHGDGAKVMADHGTFPATKKLLEDPSFQSEKNEYFGRQEVNKVLAEAAERKVSKFQYLPYNSFAQSKYGDDVVPAFQGKTTLKDALAKYAKTLADYGTDQGYTVSNQ